MLNDRAILLFGMPRSGTTWIGKIFDSHPDTLYRHEPDAWGRLNAMPLLPELGSAVRYRSALTEFVARLPDMRDVKVAATLPIFKKNYYSVWDGLMQRLVVKGAKAAARFAGEFVVPIPAPKGAYVLVWKSIESVGRLGAVSRLLPNARCVHIMRHPCGYVASVIRGEAKRKFSDRSQSSEDYGIYERLLETSQARRRALTLASLKQMHPIERLAWRWLLFNEKAMDDCENNRQCKIVRYEDVCADPTGATRDMFAFAGLEWCEQTAQFVGASTATERTSYYSVYKDPLRAANKWREELSEQDQARVWNVIEGSRPGGYYADERVQSIA